MNLPACAAGGVHRGCYRRVTPHQSTSIHINPLFPPSSSFPYLLPHAPGTSQVLFREAPRLSVEHRRSQLESLCCGQCHCYLDSVEAQLSRRLEHGGYAIKKLDLCQPALGKMTRALPAAVQCRGGCAAAYCGDDCRDAAWAGHHKLLCAGPDAPKAPAEREALEAFNGLAATWTDHLELAARVLANTASVALRRIDAGEAEAPALVAAWAPWRQGVKDEWWRTAGSSEATDGMSRADFEVEVKKVTAESLALLQAAVPAEAARFPGLFSVEVWSAVLGMLDMNCMGIKVGCPIREYLDHVLGLDPASPGADAARADAGQLWELLPGVYDAFCDGGGFFSLQSVINHDCDPNCISGKQQVDADGKITIRSLRTIGEGEELSLSYVERSLKVAERQAELSRSYQFDCSCQRCRSALEKKARKRRKLNKGDKSTAPKP